MRAVVQLAPTPVSAYPNLNRWRREVDPPAHRGQAVRPSRSPRMIRGQHHVTSLGQHLERGSLARAPNRSAGNVELHHHPGLLDRERRRRCLMGRLVGHGGKLGRGQGMHDGQPRVRWDIRDAPGTEGSKPPACQPLRQAGASFEG